MEERKYNSLEEIDWDCMDQGWTSGRYTTQRLLWLRSHTMPGEGLGDIVDVGDTTLNLSSDLLRFPLYFLWGFRHVPPFTTSLVFLVCTIVWLAYRVLSIDAEEDRPSPSTSFNHVLGKFVALGLLNRSKEYKDNPFPIDLLKDGILFQGLVDLSECKKDKERKELKALMNIMKTEPGSAYHYYITQPVQQRGLRWLLAGNHYVKGMEEWVEQETLF